jgi:putative flippase GtrA
MEERSLPKKTRKRFIHLAKYSIGHLTGGVGYFALLYLLTDYLHVYYILSAILAFFISTTIAYTITKKIAFGEKIRHKYFQKWFKFVVVSGIIVAPLNLIILFVATEFLGVHYILSALFAGIICFVLKYLGDIWWSFKEKKC